MENNLLTEKWLTVVSRQGDKRKVSLPELFSELERNDVADFPALLPHQRGPFHVFLVQLACHALETSGAAEHLPDPTPEEPWKLLGQHSPDEWQQMIRGIVPGYFEQFPNDEPWCLITNDLSKPAFMQCPVAQNSWGDYKAVIHPDDLDLLIASKNFGIKSGTLQNAQTEDWFFALISLQTNCGYGGAGYYACSRQNGSCASRPIFTLQYTTSPCARWGRNVRVILEKYDNEEFDSLNRNALFAPERLGKRLLWLDPWDGRASYRLDELHPLFIEISRRVRAVKNSDKILFRQATSKCARIENDTDQTGGYLGDPWEPTVIEKKKIKVFGSKTSYAHIANILADSNDCRKPLLLHWHEGIDPENEMSLWYSMVMKGQCVTDGYTEKVIPIDVQNMIVIETFFAVSSAMIDLAGTAKKVLGEALAVYLQCGNGSSDSKNSKIDWSSSVIKTWMPVIQNQMEQKIDADFFPHLWRACDAMKEAGDELDNNRATAEWKNHLAQLVNTYYKRGVESLPRRSAQRIKAQAVSRLRLRALIAKNFATDREDS